MAKGIAAVVGGLAAIGLLISWGVDGNEAIHWQAEADADMIQVAQRHDKDIEGVYQMLADEKRYDRVQRNLREYDRRKFAFENDEWKTQGGKDMLEKQIDKLEAAICRDDPRQDICLMQ